MARWKWAASTRHGSHRMHGQAMVEFALVITPVLMMIFGIVEFSLITSSIGTFNFAAKDAARLGTLLGRSDATADQQMVSLIRLRAQSVVAAKPISIEIFKSDATGAYSTTEDNYDISGNSLGTQSWPPSSRNDTLLAADYLGVRITFSYTYLTAFLSGGAPNLTLTAQSVQRIEPQDFLGMHASPAARMVRVTAPQSLAAPDSLAALWNAAFTPLLRRSRDNALAGLHR